MENIDISKIFILNEEPSNAVHNRFWFNPTTKLLKRYNETTTDWEDINISANDVKIVVNDEEQTLTSYLTSTISTIGTALDSLENSKSNKITELTDLTSTTISVAIEGNTIYKYGTLTSLTFNTVEDSLYESIIIFTSGDTATTFNYPSSVRTTVEEITIEASKSYVVVISNNIMVVSELY